MNPVALVFEKTGFAVDDVIGHNQIGAEPRAGPVQPKRPHSRLADVPFAFEKKRLTVPSPRFIGFEISIERADAGICFDFLSKGHHKPDREIERLPDQEDADLRVANHLPEGEQVRVEGRFPVIAGRRMKESVSEEVRRPFPLNGSEVESEDHFRESVRFF